MSSNRINKIMALVNQNSSNELTTRDSDSEKSLSLLHSSTSSTGPGYIEEDPNVINSSSYQETPKSVVIELTNLQNERTDIGMSVSFESDRDEDDDIRDPDYESEDSSGETSENDLEQNRVGTRIKKFKCSKKLSFANDKRKEKTKELHKEVQIENEIIGCNDSQDNELSKTRESSEFKDINVDQRSLNIANLGKQTKKHFCLFCKKMQSKFARHLQNKHSDKPQVKLFLSLPKKSIERLHIIDKLRKDGDFIYNSDMSYNQGDVILVRRPPTNKIRTVDHYLPCGNCSAMYSKLSINVHYRMCVKEREKFKKDTLCASRLKSYVNPKANYLMKNKILPPMRNNDINALVRREELIILFGNRLTQKYRSPHLFKMIRARLRCVGKFFWLFRKQRPDVNNFESIFVPFYYDDVIKTINKMAGLNEATGKYTSPSTAACICSYLKKLCLHLVSEMIKRNEDNANLERVRNFHQLMQDGFAYDIYKTVTENQMEMKRNKVIKLPSSDDINLLRQYLDKYIRQNMKLLNQKFSEDCWKNLSGAVLVSLQLFNRRRAGEIERVKILDFKEYEAVDVNDDINQNLEIDQNQNYVRFLIRGKRGRGVPVLVDKFKVKCLKMILKYREMANVPSTNPFLFGISGKDDVQHLEANRLMSHFARCCGAKNPKSLRGTELRKHFATKCGTMDLQGVDIKDVADYMGHHEKIHLEHYRMPNATRDIVRMSRLLEQAQGIDNFSSRNNPAQDENFEQNSEFDDSMQQNSSADIENKTTDQSIRNKTVTLSSTPDEKRRISWSKEERKLVEDKANFYLQNFESPTMGFCASLAKDPVLKRRSIPALKAYIMNEIKRRKNSVLNQKTKCKRGIKKYWTEEEKEIVFVIFQENLKSRKLPSLAACRKVIAEHKTFTNRTPEMLKAFISNVLKKK